MSALPQSNLLGIGQTVDAHRLGPVVVKRFIGGGGQGEVYEAAVGAATLALKWYFPDYLPQDPLLENRLVKLIGRQAPNRRFLWPCDLVRAAKTPSFGYLMPLREVHYASITDVLSRRVDPSSRAIVTACFELADAFACLHAAGLCYHDINRGNLFIAPTSGEIRVCDNDNVSVNNDEGGIWGHPQFMAPEIGLKRAKPSQATDIHSLAIALFELLLIDHPFIGARQNGMLDAESVFDMLVRRPIFIFDPRNDTNRPIPGAGDSAARIWPTLPRHVRELFVQAFTVGLHDPSSRVQESQWQEAMLRVRDAIYYCHNCRVELFYDVGGGEKVRPACWRCQATPKAPVALCIGDDTIVLNDDTRLQPHHLRASRRYEIEAALAAVSVHPSHPTVRGLRNLSNTTWMAYPEGGSAERVDPGRSIAIQIGCRIDFGNRTGVFVDNSAAEFDRVSVAG